MTPKPHIFRFLPLLPIKTVSSISIIPIFLITFLLISLLNFNTALAAPKYAPGQTLDPDCLPTDPDCTVSTVFSSIAIGTSTPSALLTIQGTSTTAVLGSEMIIATADRDFSSDTTNWTGTGWTVGSNVITHTAGANALTLNTLALSAAPVSGNTYQITFDINTTATGTLTPSIGGVSGPAYGQSLGSLTGQVEVVTATGVGALTFTPSATWTGTIDNVSVKQINITPALVTLNNSDGTVGLEMRGGGSGLMNTFIGLNSGQAITTGNSNTSSGWGTLFANITGSSNTASGVNALHGNTTGSNNTASGASALLNNTTGSNNTSYGQTSLRNNTSGSKNSVYGSGAIRNNSTGSNNSVLGYSAGFGSGNVSDINNSVLLGYQSGFGLKTGGDNNTLVGYQSGFNLTTGAANIIIGSNVNAASTTATGQLNIGNVLFGTGMYSNSTVSATPTVNGMIGIGTSSPLSKLQVSGVLPKIYLSDTNGTLDNKHWFMENNAGVLSFGTTTDGQVVSNTRALTILNNGNVGMGTTSPVSKLEISGGNLASGIKAFNITGTLPDSAASSIQQGVYILITSNGTSNARQYASNIQLDPGYTGSFATVGTQISNNAAGTGATLFSGTNYGNAGARINATGVTTGTNYGVMTNVAGGNANYGVFGTATGVKTSATNIGIAGFGRNDSGVSSVQIGGYFQLNNTTPIYESAALIADNSDQTSPIFLARDNGLTVFTVKDGGFVGVSTTSPWRTLSINGTMGIQGLTSSSVGNALCITANNEVTTASVASCAGVSSLRFKHDITPADLGLSTILNFRPVAFRYNEGYGDSGKDKQFGLIAEEVQKVDPRLIILDAGGQPTAVRYDFLPTILIRAVQELNAKIEAFIANGIATVKSLVVETITAAVGNFKQVKTDDVQLSGQVCVDNGADTVCVTKEQFRQMLLNAGGTVVNPSPTSSPAVSYVSPSPTAPSTSSGQATPVPTPSASPTPTPVVTSEAAPTPEASATPTPSPSVIAEPTPTPSVEPTPSPSPSVEPVPIATPAGE